MDIIDKAIGIFIVAAIVPAAMTSLNSANTSGWNATQVALWGLVGVLVIVGIFKWITV